jgi:cell division protein FtsL
MVKVAITYELLMDGLVHMFILLCVLSVLFIVVISQTETRALQTEFDSALVTYLEKALNDAQETALEQNNVNIKEKLSQSNQVLAFARREFSQPDRAVRATNRGLYFRATVICVAMLLLIIVSFLVAKYVASMNIWPMVRHISISNLTILIMAGAIEYLVFTRVAVKYIPVLPSKITDTLITSLKQTFAAS